MQRSHLILRRILMLIPALALLSAAAACSLSSNNNKGRTNLPTLIPTRPMNLTLTPGTVIPAGTLAFPVTPTFTLAGGAQPGTVNTAPTRANCVVQANWPVYTVAAGDTLGVIAEVTGATVDQLVQANCLSSTELIFVGQQIRVPGLPSYPTAAPTIPNTGGTGPIFGQQLAAVPYWMDANRAAVTYSETVRLDVGTVINAISVSFYVNDPTGGPAIYVGQDVDPWDGAFVDYDFPATGIYSFQAVAYGDTAQRLSNIFTITYNPTFTPPEGQRNVLSLSPYISFQNGTYTLQTGATISVGWADAPVGATRIDFTYIPRGTGPSQVVGSDLNPADGTLITWAVPVGTNGTLTGTATMPDGSTFNSELATIATQ